MGQLMFGVTVAGPGATIIHCGHIHARDDELPGDGDGRPV